MNELLLNENDYWNVIEDMNWFEISAVFKHEANEKVKEYCLEYLTEDDIIRILNFVVEKRNHLLDFLKNRSIVKTLNLSDDGIWDLASHIVGLGKTMYYSVLNHLEIIKSFEDERVENFEYGFDAAIYQLKNDEYDMRN